MEVTLEPWQRDMVLRALFELTMAFVDDEDLRFECTSLAAAFGGNPREMFYGADRWPGVGG